MVDGVSRWQVVGDVAQRRAGPHDPAPYVEYLAQVVVALRRVLGHQRQIRRDETPFLVADVTRILLPDTVCSISQAYRTLLSVHNSP